MTYRCARTLHFEIALCPCSLVYCSTTSSPGSSLFSFWQCYNDMGIPVSVLGIPIPKTLVIWASPVILPWRFGLELGLQGMPISLEFWEWGCPKCGDAHITVTAGKGKIFSFRKQKNPETRMHCSVLMVCLRKLVCALTKKIPKEFPTVFLDKRLCLAYVKHWSYHGRLNQTISRLISCLGAHQP